MPHAIPARSRSTLLILLALWLAFYASFTLFAPPLLDDADSVHAEVAREMLLRHDYITLYANGIRYLEKAPLLYWSMAATMRLFQLFGATSPRALAVAARLPLALTLLALALLVEAFARRIFYHPNRATTAARTGLYAALILLSSFGIFLFTRILIPDAAVCLFTTLALYAFWRTEELGSPQPPVLSTDANPTSGISTGVSRLHARRSGEIPALALTQHPHKPHHHRDRLRLYCGLFAAACALNVLTKGLIGVVFPVAIVAIYLLITRGLRRTLRRLRELHPLATLEAFLLIAAPWHLLIGLANPTQGHPAPFRLVHFHWQVPLPTLGNVHGWFWFYFMNEHLLRYLNLRVPHDYDTAPLWLFWGLCFIWMMPWSAFLFKATAWAAPLFGTTERTRIFRSQLRRHDLPLKRRGALLLLVWAAVILLFFTLSTRQEYYVLPALPALAILIAAWLAHDSLTPQTSSPRPPLANAQTSLANTQAPLANTRVPRGFSLGGVAGALSPDSETRGPISHPAITPGAPFLTASHPEWVPPTSRATIRITTVLLLLGTLFAAASLLFLLHTQNLTPTHDLATLLTQHPNDYALSLGHFLDLTGPALTLFQLPLALAAAGLFLGPLAALILRKRARPHAANLALAAGAFTFLLAAHLGLQTFAPVLTSAQLAEAIAPQVHSNDLIVLHGEYESASTLGFYLQRSDLHLLEGRSSNLWYGSFFTDAPAIFETPQTLAQKWATPQRIFLWQSLTDPPNQLPNLPAPVYVLTKSGGKEILSNQANP